MPVPEAKTVKNRMHVDVVGDTDALLAAGATLLRDLWWSAWQNSAKTPARRGE